MNKEYFRRPKEKFSCFYITKDNVKDFVKKYGGLNISSITIEEYYAKINYPSRIWYIRLNAFIVKEHDGWNSYTEEDFNEYYEIEI